MAYGYFISTKQKNDRIKIPEWIGEHDDRMKSYTSNGEVVYRGDFASKELLQLANDYAKLWEKGARNDSHTDLQNQGLEYIKNANTDAFTLSPIYWSSDTY